MHKFILKYVGSPKIPARQQILSTTATLFAANIRYHKSCDQSFRASYWKKHLIDELSDVIEYLNVLKREIYTIRQVCESMQRELALIQCEASI